MLSTQWPSYICATLLLTALPSAHPTNSPFHHCIHLITGHEYDLISHLVPLRKSYISILHPAWEGGKWEEPRRS